jgi:hypothetical protein
VTTWAAAAEALNMPGPMGVRCARACSATMLVSADEWKSRIWRAGEETERRDYRATEAKIHHRLGMTRWFNEWARRNRPDARYGDHDLALTWQWVHVAHAHLDLSPAWRGKRPPPKTAPTTASSPHSLDEHQRFELGYALHKRASRVVTREALVSAASDSIAVERRDTPDAKPGGDHATEDAVRQVLQVFQLRL